MNKSAQSFETAPKALNEETGKTVKKNVTARIFAALFAVITVAVAFLIDVKILVGAAPQSLKLFNAVKDVFSSSQKAFGLPVLVTAFDYPTNIAGLALYAFVGFLAISVILAIITVFCSKKAPALLRAVTFFFTAGWATNAIAVFAFTYYQTQTKLLDLYSLALVAFGALVYFILAIAKNGKKAWLNQLNAILSIGVYAVILLAMLGHTADFKAGLDSGLKGAVSFKIVLFAVCPLAILNALVVAIRMQTKKGLAFDLVRYIVQFIVAVAVCYIAIMSKGAKAFLFFAIATAGVSLVQIVIGIIENKCKNGKKEKAMKAPKEKKVKKVKEKKQATTQEVAPVQEPVPAMPAIPAMPAPAITPVVTATPVQPTQPATAEIPAEYVVEEYAEALPYDGGPVEGVALAQEVNPTFTSMPARPVETAGYDFYNSKSFDPFIAILDNQERNQFTEIFILKYKGEMPEIPDYVVGGDNKEFFRKLFIYLGQYRDRMPDGLLAKIYQFTVKMK